MCPRRRFKGLEEKRVVGQIRMGTAEIRVELVEAISSRKKFNDLEEKRDEKMKIIQLLKFTIIWELIAVYYKYIISRLYKI